MKTTVQIPDPLLARAKAVARAAGTTLAALVTEGLRRVVEERGTKRRAFKLRSASVSGKGMSPEYATGWDAVREAAYEGRGTIAVDTNLLVYAHRKDSEWHARAEPAVRRLAEGVADWAIPWPCIHEFLAIVTHPRIYTPPSTLEQALEQVRAWLEAPSLVLLAESGSHLETLEGLLRAGHVVGPRVHDARVAAICLEHGIDELWSADRDFSRFPDILVRNPLVAGDDEKR